MAITEETEFRKSYLIEIHPALFDTCNPIKHTFSYRQTWRSTFYLSAALTGFYVLVGQCSQARALAERGKNGILRVDVHILEHIF
jgi:hypothetical protein